MMPPPPPPQLPAELQTMGHPDVCGAAKERLLMKLQTSPEGELLPKNCGDRTLSACPDTQRRTNILLPFLVARLVP